MNYLQLVQRLHSESGRHGTAPTTVIGLTAMNLKLANWILSAYEDIQNLHETWLFRQGEFSFPTVATTQNYTQTAAGLTDLARWKFNSDHNEFSGIRIYSSVADEQDLSYLPWEDFRAIYKYGTARSQPGRPNTFTVKTNLSIDLWPIPNAVFTVNGEYIKQPGTLSIDTSTPILPSQFHMSIVWRALMVYGAYEGAPEKYSHGQDEYNKTIARLEMNQLPQITWGAPFA